MCCDYTQFKSIMRFRGIKKKHCATAEIWARCTKWAQTEQLTETGEWIWRMKAKVMRDALKVERWERDSGGLSLVQGEELAPSRPGNTHSPTHFTASHSLAVPWFLYPSPPPYPPTPLNTHCKYTSCSSSFKASSLSISSLQRHNKLSTNSLGFQSANQTAQACRSVHLDTPHQHTDMFLLARWQICFLQSAFSLPVLVMDVTARGACGKWPALGTTGGIGNWAIIESQN